ncbi:hypothetical protein O3P69_016783 [Scylla paramamosain]|uniref:Uncharacterized protein n=1 Tax=Scylla paramamosain TaxID=85552 RepID=A0AAW0SZM2_SCYPA
MGVNEYQAAEGDERERRKWRGGEKSEVIINSYYLGELLREGRLEGWPAAHSVRGGTHMHVAADTRASSSLRVSCSLLQDYRGGVGAKLRYRAGVVTEAANVGPGGGSGGVRRPPHGAAPKE